MGRSSEADAIRIDFKPRYFLIRCVSVFSLTGEKEHHSPANHIFYLSLLISVTTAMLLFVAVRLLLVRPISRLVRQIKSYEDSPEDASRIIEPTSNVNELREAEIALRSPVVPVRETR